MMRKTRKRVGDGNVFDVGYYASIVERGVLRGMTMEFDGRPREFLRPSIIQAVDRGSSIAHHTVLYPWAARQRSVQCAGAVQVIEMYDTRLHDEHSIAASGNRGDLVPSNDEAL